MHLPTCIQPRPTLASISHSCSPYCSYTHSCTTIGSSVPSPHTMSQAELAAWLESRDEHWCSEYQAAPATDEESEIMAQFLAAPCPYQNDDDSSGCCYGYDLAEPNVSLGINTLSTLPPCAPAIDLNLLGDGGGGDERVRRSDPSCGCERRRSKKRRLHPNFQSGAEVLSGELATKQRQLLGRRVQLGSRWLVRPGQPKGRPPIPRTSTQGKEGKGSMRGSRFCRNWCRMEPKYNWPSSHLCYVDISRAPCWRRQFTTSGSCSSRSRC